MELSLILDKPLYHVYNPGDVVYGWCILTNPRPLPSCTIWVQCSGVASVSWVDSENKTYNGSETYGETKVNLFETNSTTSAPSGKSKYAVSYRLPDQCPPSFEGKLGNIRYTISCHLSLGNDQLAMHKAVNSVHCKQEIIVGHDATTSLQGTVDSIEIKRKLNVGNEKKCFCFAAETVEASVELTKCEYKPLEQIHFTIHVQNKTHSVQVSQIRVLIQREEVGHAAVNEQALVTRRKDVAISYETFKKVKINSGLEKEWKGVAGMPAAATDLSPSKIIKLNFVAIFIVQIEDYPEDLRIEIPLKVASSNNHY